MAANGHVGVGFCKQGAQQSHYASVEAFDCPVAPGGVGSRDVVLRSHALHHTTDHCIVEVSPPSVTNTRGIPKIDAHSSSAASIVSAL